jgi:hypothetical protein
MPRHQEESEWEDWNRENVSSDKAVENTANSVVSAQGRERQSALRDKDRTKGGDSLEYLPVPSRNARRHHNGENKEQPPDTPPAQTRGESTTSEGRVAAEDEAHYRRPPASSWRDGAAVYVDDRSATASAWRGPRQPNASSWREAASVGQQGERPLMQPHASTGPAVHESCDRNLQHERPIVTREDGQHDQRSGRPEYGSQVQPGRCHGNGPAEGRPRRSLSADHGDSSEDRRYMGYPSQRTEGTILDKRRVDQFVEMPRFDGTGDLELFLQRFRTLAEYYGWTNSEQLFRLKNSIQGDAQYVVFDLLDLNDARDFVEALKARFGTSAEAERYRTELSRLRRGTLTIEQLYLKVRSLVSKAAPGSWSALTEIYARDVFLTALDDEKLKRRIMLTSPPPETLVAVYDLALRAVAVENYVARSQSEDRGDRHPPQYGRSRHARVMGAENESEPPPMATQQMKQIMEQLKEIQAAVVGFQASTEKPTEVRIDPK